MHIRLRRLRWAVNLRVVHHLAAAAGLLLPVVEEVLPLAVEGVPHLEEEEVRVAHIPTEH